MADETWTIKKIINWTKDFFESKGIENPRLDAELLLCSILNCQRIRLYMDFDKPLTRDELARFKELVVRRAAHEPLAYILGERAFMKNTFKVTPATLVPRPETELLVESIVKAAPCLREDGAVKILDIGTGSGAIVISLLAYLPNALGIGTDVSVDALLVAKENAEGIGVRQRCGFIHSDLFEKISTEKKFSVIVSNPPYIPTREISTLARDVQREPHNALDGGDDGLDFYRKICARAFAYLEDDGLLAFEVGSGQAQAVRELCEQAGFARTAVRRDYQQIERMVFATKEKAGDEQKYADLLLEITRQL